MIEPETIIDGRYRVVSRLGSGGMADVYLAEDQLLGRHVAIKVLHHQFAEDQEFVERFRREASSAAALSHPNIVGIFDRGQWNGTYYIAMEYVAGRTLKAIVREDGAVEPARAIDIVIQILRAARFAHKRGVIHRDLKPHNVILDEEGRARVTDFGIARAGASDMTLTGSIMGTAQYLSPEQAQGHAVTASSDLYSIGVILYELLTGVVPFEGETAVAIAFKQVSSEPRPPSELNPVLPASLDAVVLRALAKDSSQRYADAEEFIAVLQHERQALALYSPSSATPVAAGARTADPPAQGHGGDHVGAPALLLPPAAYGEDDEGPPGAGRRRRWPWILLATLVAAGVAVAVLLLAGTGKVTVPDVSGQTEQAAGAILRHAGLTPIPSLAPSATVPTGRVVRQSPGPGTLASKGARVNIVISGGPASTALVNVEGLTSAQALARLRAAGFKPASTPQPSSTVAAGHVINTDPAAGTLVQVGSPVTVFVSSGPAPVHVPDVSGQRQSAAEAAIRSAGLTVGSVTPRSSTQPPGSVISQSPTGGTSAPAGSKVDLTIAQAPKPKEATVPDVVGKKEAAAVSLLEKAGFTPKTATTPSTEEAKVGAVLEQSPAAGAHARKGATVTITVGAAATTTTPTTPTTTPTTPTTTGATPPASAPSEHK